MPEVDAVCSAYTGGDRSNPRAEAVTVDHALTALGGARAAAGAGLSETLTDLAAFHAVLDEPAGSDGFVAPDVDAPPARMVRIVALGWAEIAVERIGSNEVVEPMTGLPTAGYLRTRLAELYRAAGSGDAEVADWYVLLVVSMDFTTAASWARLTGMILASDAIRRVFDGGETLAALGPSTAAVLLPRNGGLPCKTIRLRRDLEELLGVDTQFDTVGPAQIKPVRLPRTHDAACALIADLGRR